MTIIRPLEPLHAKCVPASPQLGNFIITQQCGPCSANTWLCAPWEWILLLFHTLWEIYVFSLSVCVPCLWMHFHRWIHTDASPPSITHTSLDSIPLSCRLGNVNNLGKCANLFSGLILSSFDMNTRCVGSNSGFLETIVASIFMHAKWILHKQTQRVWEIESWGWIERTSIASSARWKCWVNAPFRMHINVRSVLWFSWLQFEPKQKASHH